jgi:hypothetical protein
VCSSGNTAFYAKGKTVKLENFIYRTLTFPSFFDLHGMKWYGLSYLFWDMDALED